jgi:hypothetical protein
MSSWTANISPRKPEGFAAAECAQSGYIRSQSNSTSSQLFESFNDIPAVWNDICHREDLAMDIKVLGVFQRTLVDQCRCWGMIVYDARGIAIGCAALCLFQTEVIESKNPFVIRWRERLRCVFPRLGRMPVLFCGLPVPSGASHLRVREGASPEAVVTEIDRAMQRLARSLGARLTVFKELDDASPLISTLSCKGYIRGAVPPMHLLDVSFDSFAHYRDALKSRYRSQVKRSQKKMVSAGFEVLHGRGHAFVAEHFDEHVHRLYMAVHGRAEHKLELMPASFFREMATALEDEVLLTVIRREGRIFAFTFAITRGRTHYNMYSGLDYTLNNEGDLYFNLFYHDMDQAFRAGATSLHLGQTSDTFKSRLGMHAQKLWFFARARSSLFNTLLHFFAPLVFPKVAEVEPNDVFAEMRGITAQPPNNRIR